MYKQVKYTEFNTNPSFDSYILYKLQIRIHFRNLQAVHQTAMQHTNVSQAHSLQIRLHRTTINLTIRPTHSVHQLHPTLKI